MPPSEARQAALNALAAVRRGYDPQATKAAKRASPSVSRLIDMYEEDHLPKLKPTTRQGYKLALHRLRKAHGHLKAEELTRRHVAALHAALASSPYAANRLLATVASLYSYAARRDLVDRQQRDPGQGCPPISRAPARAVPE